MIKRLCKISGKVFIFAYLLVCLCIGCLSNQTAFAFAEETTEYTTGVADLSKDKSFKTSNYPYIAEDYSINVIQIAVGENEEGLFIYTYQPSQPTKRLTATEINLNFDYAPAPRIYGLTMISSEGTICKYRLDLNFKLSSMVTFVNITSISRPYDASIDPAPTAGTTTITKAYPVAQCWKIAYDSSMQLVYLMEQTDVVTIIDPFVGYIEYNNGFFLTELNHCRSHFVAFSTDHQIDELQEAELFYVSQSARQQFSLVDFGRVTYGDPVDQHVTLNDDQFGENTPNVFGKTYRWKRIQSTEDFIEHESLTAEAENSVSSSQWVLRFVETPYLQHNGANITVNEWTDISDVTILRLKFVTDGVTYDLGAVMNKTSGDNIADNTNTNELAPTAEVFQNIKDRLSSWFDQLAEMLHMPKWAVIAIAVVLGVIILGIVLSTFFPNVVLPIIKTLFQAIFWILSLPFKALAAIIDRLRS